MEPITNRFGPQLIEQLREQVSNLMAAVQLLTPTIREQEDPHCDQYLAILNQSLYRMLRLMNHMEYAQRMEGGEDLALFRPEALDLARLCRDLCNQVMPLAQQAGVEFRYEEELPSLLLTGDTALIRQMLLNLFSNAIRAAGEGGEAGLRLTGTKGRAILTIWDNGQGDNLPGAPEQELKEDLEDEPALKIEKRSGLGLGLLLARQIAVLHGGTIVFERREVCGVRATVSMSAEIKGKPGTLRSPKRMGYDASGGFSPVMVELSSILPYRAFLPEDVE